MLRYRVRSERNSAPRTPISSPTRSKAAQTRHQPQEQTNSPRFGSRAQPPATGLETASLARKSPIQFVVSPVQQETPFSFGKPENNYVPPSSSRGQPSQIRNLQPQPQNSNLQRHEQELYQRHPNNPMQERGHPSLASSSRPIHPENTPSATFQAQDRVTEQQSRKKLLRDEFNLRYITETARLKTRRNQMFWCIPPLSGILLLMTAYYNSSLTEQARSYCNETKASETCTACPQNSKCSGGRVVSCTGDFELHGGFCIHHQADPYETLKQVNAAVLMLAEQKGRLTCEDSVFHPSFSRPNMKDFLAKFRTGERFELNREQALKILMNHPMIEYNYQYEYQSRNIKYTQECFRTMFLHQYKKRVILITLLITALTAVVYYLNSKVSMRENAQKIYSFLENEVIATSTPISENNLRYMLFQRCGISLQEVHKLWPEILVHAGGNRRLKASMGQQFGDPVQYWARS